MNSPSDAKDRNIAAGLFSLGFLSLLLTEKASGFVRDESVYFAAAESHARWFKLLFTSPVQAVSDQAITQAFQFNAEHPALMKHLYGLSYLLFHETLGLLRPAAAFRLPAFLFAALILPLTYLMVRPLTGRVAAAIGAASFLLVPRQFFEAHLSCFDVPVTAMWLLVVFCFVRALEQPRWWVYTGLAFGAAIATKHNALFLPPLLALFAFWCAWKTSAGDERARTLFFRIVAASGATALSYALMIWVWGIDQFQTRLTFLSPPVTVAIAALISISWWIYQLAQINQGTFRPLASIAAMSVLGPLIFWLHWPYLWHHGAERVAWYIKFHATHNHYAWFYLGKLLREPPFPLDYVVIVTALTVPIAFFAPMVFGLGQFAFKAWKRNVTLLEVLIVANALTSMAIISQPQVPHFGGVKHWFPSMPFMAMLLAQVLDHAGHAIHHHFSKARADIITAALGVFCSVSALIATVRVYPYGTSFYSELAGGLPGGATLGMQRQFWANNVTGVLPWINEHARPGERVYLHECHGGQIHDYQRNGMLRTDLRFVGDPFGADIVAYQYHQEFREHEFNTWQSFNTTKPVTGLYVDETPQVIVYRRTMGR